MDRRGGNRVSVEREGELPRAHREPTNADNAQCLDASAEAVADDESFHSCQSSDGRDLAVHQTVVANDDGAFFIYF